jgi:hypothetical protein
MTKSDWRNVWAWIYLKCSWYWHKVNPWCKFNRQRREIKRLEIKLGFRDEEGNMK